VLGSEVREKLIHWCQQEVRTKIGAGTKDSFTRSSKLRPQRREQHRTRPNANLPCSVDGSPNCRAFVFFGFRSYGVCLAFACFCCSSSSIHGGGIIFIIIYFVGSEVPTAVVMKSAVFWDITPCSPLKVNRRFGGTYRLHLHGRRISRVRNQRESRWHAELLARLIIRP
jgi:hypothetical protein